MPADVQIADFRDFCVERHIEKHRRVLTTYSFCILATPFNRSLDPPMCLRLVPDVRLKSNQRVSYKTYLSIFKRTYSTSDFNVQKSKNNVLF